MILVHNHVDKGSNIRNLDSIIKTKDLINYAVELNLKGIGITDHESLSAHVEAIRYVKENKENGNIPKDFKLILGNEIYLIDSLEEVRDNYKPGETKFYHFILLAKNEEGHKQLRELSSIAWSKNYFKTRKMERVPTVKTDIENIIGKNKGHIIGCTACLGGEFANLVLKLIEIEKGVDKIVVPSIEEEIKNIKIQIHQFITWCINIFGKENFFIEIQPSRMKEQIDFNKKAIQIAKAYGLKWIVTTDSHYLKKEDREIHKAYLQSQDAEREIDDFYSSTYVMNEDEIYEYMSDYLDKEDIKQAIENTHFLGEMIQEYDLYHPVIVPKVKLPKFEVQHKFKKYYDKYPYIKKFAYSNDEYDRYYLYLVEKGLYKKEPAILFNEKEYHKRLNRINEELKELWLITEEINIKLSSYYITTREIINLMWTKGDSLVGVARGSVTGWYTAYLMDITQMNPIKWNLPHWRHIHHSRPDLPDIDLDSQQSRRKQILQTLKEYFGERKVLNICTFGTEGSRSALLTACRGLGIDVNEAQFLSSLIPSTRGQNWSLHDCFYGNEEENKMPVKELINEVAKYPKLKEVALAIEGLVNKRSIHASGVYIFQDDFVNQNAMMRSPNGQPTTQFDMGDSDYMGGLKVDLLTIEALDKIRIAMDMLIEDGYMEWQGTLRDTYNKYLHPDVLDYETPEMWNMLANNEIISLFQFDTEVGSTSAQRIKPKNLIEMATANSVMRLMSDSEEQPIDTYIKYKNDISLWYKEMEEYGLTEDEIKVLEKHLKVVYGVADTQEIVMELVMDKKIANFNIKEANKLRKGIAKKKKDIIKEIKELFYLKGQEIGTSKNMLDYVWNVQISRQLGYSFSKNHTFPYSCIGLQEMNLAYHYPKIYWNTAVLTVEAGANENNEDNKGTDYGKIAQAINLMKTRGIKVALPDINKASFGFKPDIEHNQIIFGLKGINGIGDDLVYHIIKNRPYTSLEDFMQKNPISISQLVSLVKAGCFDAVENIPREKIMEKVIRITSKPKSKLNMQNLNILITYNLIPEEFHKEVRYFRYRKYITKNKPYKKVGKDKWYLLDDIATKFYYEEEFDENAIKEYVGTNIVISLKEFDKDYKARIEKIKKWITSNEKELLKQLNEKLFNETWKKYASGNISSWEMDALCFYYHEHELKNVNKEKYGIVNFFELPEEPEVVGYVTRNNKKFPKYNIVRIMGTVLDKDKHKHTILLLTTEGVVTVKFYSGAFSHYDKQISKQNKNGEKQILEKSWFTRGNKLLIVGYRKGKQFKPKKYSDTIYTHTVALITQVKDNGDISIQAERVNI